MHHTVHNLPGFIQTLAPFIHKYGYFGMGGLIFLEDFGALVPGETVLIACAVFAGLGQLNIFLVGLIGFISAVIGDNVGYAIGNFGGHPLINRYGKYVFLTPKRVAKAEAYFNSKGGRIVIVARFIDGLRQLNGLLAGLSEMHWLRFLAYNAIGAGLWVGLWTTVGYYGGDHINTFLRYELYLTIAVIIFLIVYFVKLYMKKKQEKNS